MLASRRGDAGRRRIGIKGRENTGAVAAPGVGASAGGDRCAVPGRYGRRGNRNVNGS
ncbi:hypothetical protein BCR44DRAFT_1442494 [Catenaria anguillulae PL171]|uniref:Uncharacterized protein n=1 Tax=Catenaria anguillulae PL171 TaxID=765915 RepID=A0A1Y2HE65_9FUNG|nr:hypothetical protein BCR44DRAFT_1442494 [Catenaria anguillulae PL171]